MKRAIYIAIGILVAALAAGCGDGAAQTDATKSATGAPDALVKLSSDGYAGYCSIAAAADGTLHAIYTDAKAYGKPHYVYYRASKDGGASWTEPKNLSDDESGLGASWCSVKVDAKGRPYAVWKYIDENTSLDGPGGCAGGIIAVRCLEGGNWSKAVRFGDKHQPACSWFAANGPDGKVSVVYTQAQSDIDQENRGMQPHIADNLSQTIFDGGGAPNIVPILVAKPLPTKEEIEAAHEAGKDLTWEQQNVQPDGIWNLRGYIAADGRPRFIGEMYHPSSQDATPIVRYDGASVSTLYNYKGYLSYNTFNCPPMLALEADGKEHLIRKPEVSEHEVMRDYPITNGAPAEPGDAQQALANDSEQTKIFNWHISPLEGGRVAVMVALSPKGMYDDANDLYLALGDGQGHWSKPINVTNNDARATGFAKAGVSQFSSYQPAFADACAMKDGSVGVLMVNTEHTLSGINTVAITGSGSAVTGTSSSSSSSPYVFFTKVKG